MPLASIVLILLAGATVAAAGRLVWMWLKFRGDRVITCPANMRPAGVKVDARHAAASSLVQGPDLRLRSCTRWPEMAGCGQECLKQIEAAPGGCLVRNILAEWYDGETCASCGRQFGPMDWTAPKPAVRTGEGGEMEWEQIPVDQIYDVLAKGAPICFSCHMAGRLMREHPDLAVDRGRPALQSGGPEIHR